MRQIGKVICRKARSETSFWALSNKGSAPKCDSRARTFISIGIITGGAHEF